MVRRLTQDEFARWLRLCAKGYANRQAFARELNVSAGYLSDVLNGVRRPSAKFLAKLHARAVRLIEIDAA